MLADLKELSCPVPQAFFGAVFIMDASDGGRLSHRVCFPKSVCIGFRV